MIVFDGHNDTLLRLVTTGTHFDGDDGQLNLNAARTGNFAGGLFACFVPSPGSRDAGFQRTPGGYTVTMPPPPGLAEARRLTDAMVASATRLPNANLCRNTADIHASIAAGTLAIVLHLEGAEAIAPGLDGLETYYAAGIRSIGPVWSRPNHFGIGVPFQYPGNPGIGPGLTPAGLELVRACNALGIMLDVSHLNAAGFWDVACTSRAPLVATHSGAHAICPVPRNLTDDQLRAIRDTGGLVGLTLSVSELHPDGHNDPATPLATVMRHMDHLLNILGPAGVALGSDFDGATLPAEIGTSAGLPNLVAAMQSHGYDAGLLAKICHQNWLTILDRSWSARR